MFVKICGIKSLEELRMVENYADAGGVVVRSNSKRRIGLEKAREIIKKASIPIFAVSTHSSFEVWRGIIEKTKAEYIQVHSEMSVEEFEKLRSEYSVVITKAFIIPRSSVNPKRCAERMLSVIDEYNADYHLLDTGTGSGKLHDLRVSREIIRRIRNGIIAGGLNPENVAEIANYVKPFGVDVSSGVETNGMKDPKLISNFFGALRNLEVSEWR